MGINSLFTSNQNDNDNEIENSADINNNNKSENKDYLLSNKEFYNYYILSLANLINKNVILLGDEKIGKTKLFNLILNKSENNDEINLEQNYAYFEEKKINIKGFDININIWDTPGGDKHKEANKHFIKDCIISYLCFHFKIKKSFESVKNYYINIVKEINGKDTFIILVGIKNKIFGEEDENEENIISINTIRNFAENNNILYYAISLDDINSINYFFYDSIKQYSLHKAKINFVNNV